MAVSVPAELDTAQAYSPASVNFTSVSSNKVEFDKTVILHLSAVVRVTDPLRHVTDGVGKPLKIELKTTVCPRATVWLLGRLVIFGMATHKEQNRNALYNVLRDQISYCFYKGL